MKDEKKPISERHIDEYEYKTLSEVEEEIKEPKNYMQNSEILN
jgi:hypothetical protein